VARISVTGADRVRYLNGQLSNDLRALEPGAAQQSLILTAKGKLCAVVNAWLEGEAIVVEAGGIAADDLLARLERYAISDDVAFEVLPETGVGWHVFGLAAEGLAGLKIHRLGCEGRDVSEIPASVPMASDADVEILRIERGVPQWGRELSEDTLPQEAGLEKSAVNFWKGCYVGQEVVSRIQSVGRVNRELAGLIGEFDPARAAALQTEAGEKAGHVTSAVRHPEKGAAIALAYVSTKLSASRFVVLDESGACLGAAERFEFPLVS
jgi:folate-binding protein YgfZ